MGARVRGTFGGISRHGAPAHVGADHQRRFANLHRFPFPRELSREANPEKMRGSQAKAIPFA
jgi:hypothetical protein